MKTETRKMTGGKSTFLSCQKMMLSSSLGLFVLLSLTQTCVAITQHHQSSSWREKHVESDFLSQVIDTIRKTVENLIGPENYLMLKENISSMLWLISSGISSALCLVAQIAGQCLTSIGMAGDELTQSLKLSPDKVQLLLLWSLAALIGYWILSLLLSLLLTILSHILWGLKLVLFGSCFVFIVSGVPNFSVQVSLLLALLTLHVLLGWLSGSRRSSACLEAKVHCLENQVQALQRRQRWSPRHMDDE